MDGPVFRLSSGVHWVAALAAPESYFCLVAGAGSGAGAPSARFPDLPSTATAPVRVSAAMLMASSALVREMVSTTGFQLCQVSPPHLLLPAATRPDLEAAAELLHRGTLLAPSHGALQRAAAVLTSLGVRLVTTTTDNTIAENSVTDGAATDPSVHQGLLYWDQQAGGFQGPGGGEQAAGGLAGSRRPGGRLGNDPDPLGDWEKAEMDDDVMKIKLKKTIRKMKSPLKSNPIEITSHTGSIKEELVTMEGSLAILPSKEAGEAGVWPTVKAEGELAGGVACTLCPSTHTTDLGLVAHSRKHFPEARLLPCTAGCGSLHGATELARHYRTRHTDQDRFRCVVCGHRTRTLQAHQVHMKKHFDSSVRQCEACGNFAPVEGKHTCKPRKGKAVEKTTTNKKTKKSERNSTKQLEN